MSASRSSTALALTAITAPVEASSQNKPESLPCPWQIHSINFRLNILHYQLRLVMNKGQTGTSYRDDLQTRIKAWEDLKSLFCDLHPPSLASKLDQLIQTNFSFLLTLLNDDPSLLIHILMYSLIITAPNAKGTLQNQVQIPKPVSDPLQNLINVLAAARINVSVAPPKKQAVSEKSEIHSSLAASTQAKTNEIVAPMPSPVKKATNASAIANHPVPVKFTFSWADINKSASTLNKLNTLPLHDWKFFPSFNPNNCTESISYTILRLPGK